MIDYTVDREMFCCNYGPRNGGRVTDFVDSFGLFFDQTVVQSIVMCSQPKNFLKRITEHGICSLQLLFSSEETDFFWR
jgi:hypothetical protein